MKAILALITIAILTAAAFGQCTLSLDKAPRLSGISLGMTPEQVIARFGKPFRQDAEHLGYVYAVPETSADGKLIVHKPSNFEGLSQLDVGLEGGKVSSISISYDYDAVKWDSPQEFAAALSDKLGLPKAWTYRTDRADMWCRDWTIAAYSVANQIILMDLAPIVKKVADDRKTADEKKRAFKP